METVATKASLWVLGLISAALGSAFSIFLERDKPLLSTKVRILAFLFGLCIGFLLGSAFNEWQDIPAGSFIGFTVQFVLGWAGIAILTEAKLQIPLAISAIRRKYFGE